MIKAKQKKCAGIGIAKGFRGCGVLTFHRTYGLCKTRCYTTWLLTTKEGKEKLEKALLKASAPRMEIQAQKLNDKARTSLGALKEQTQVIVNKYVKLRDHGQPCISSQILWKNDFDAGHCYPVKSYDGLRFNLDNIHAQSVNANRFKEGDHVEYLINLPKRIGQQRFDALLKAAEDYKKNGYKFTRVELMEIQVNMKLKIKELKATSLV